MEGTITMSRVSMASTGRCTSIETPLADCRGPAASPTISTRNGAGAPGCAAPGSAEAFITSKMPNSVEATASGSATRLT